MKIEIRPYRPEDTPAILDIINYNILHSAALYDYHPRSLEQQTAMLEDKLSKGFPVIVALEGEQLVGFGYYGEFRFREAYKYTVEHSVYAHPDCIGKGIGSMLLQALLDIAKQQNLHTMIGVIDSENKSSIAFHERFGFKTVGILEEVGFKFDRWLDAVLMMRKV